MNSYGHYVTVPVEHVKSIIDPSKLPPGLDSTVPFDDVKNWDKLPVGYPKVVPIEKQIAMKFPLGSKVLAPIDCFIVEKNLNEPLSGTLVIVSIEMMKNIEKVFPAYPILILPEQMHLYSEYAILSSKEIVEQDKGPVRQCDGKMCGKGKSMGNGRYICKHNNLQKLYPELCEEWDYDENKDISPRDFLSKSGKKIIWKCKTNPCGCHRWVESIYNRTNGSGCPFCAHRKLCDHNNLQKIYPELCEEWDYDENKGSLPKDFFPYSVKKVAWKCKTGCVCHKWKATIYNRTLHGTGCPFCNGDNVCEHNNLKKLYPELCEEWDYDENKGILPENFLPGSQEKVSWRCKNGCVCHKWEAIINSRTLGRKGCPYCNRGRVCEHNNLKTNFPEIAEEWDYEKNKEIRPEQFSYGADIAVWWTCKKGKCDCHTWEAKIMSRTVNGYGCPYCNKGRVCQHYNLEKCYPEIAKSWSRENDRKSSEISPHSNKLFLWECMDTKNCGCHRWQTTPNDRVKGTGCPYCNSGKPCKHNNLAIRFPEIVKEWSEKNSSRPEDYAPFSSEKVTWICLKGHEWQAKISARTHINEAGCPNCIVARCSKSQIAWLNQIMDVEKIVIRTALSPESEFLIPGVGRVDGYCEETRTVYEFHGSFWHGEPKNFDPEDIHPIKGKTYGELYRKTLERDDQIRNSGYILVVKWESEWLEDRKKN